METQLLVVNAEQKLAVGDRQTHRVMNRILTSGAPFGCLFHPMICWQQNKYGGNEIRIWHIFLIVAAHTHTDTQISTDATTMTEKITKSSFSHGMRSRFIQFTCTLLRLFVFRVNLFILINVSEDMWLEILKKHNCKMYLLCSYKIFKTQTWTFRDTKDNYKASLLSPGEYFQD